MKPKINEYLKQLKELNDRLPGRSLLPISNSSVYGNNVQQQLWEKQLQEEEEYYYHNGGGDSGSEGTVEVIYIPETLTITGITGGVEFLGASGFTANNLNGTYRKTTVRVGYAHPADIEGTTNYYKLEGIRHDVDGTVYITAPNNFYDIAAGDPFFPEGDPSPLWLLSFSNSVLLTNNNTSSIVPDTGWVVRTGEGDGAVDTVVIRGDMNIDNLLIVKS